MQEQLSLDALKVCTKCGEAKPIDAFHRRARNTGGHEAHCKKCAQKKGREWEINNPEKRRAIKRRYLKRNRARLESEYRVARYGITSEEWDALFEQQGRVCAICGSDTPGTQTIWNTDHCHATGVVRGILCRNCNLGLGHFGDDQTKLRGAIRYLRRYQPKP